ncbi:hypothetical protein [Chryseobacterium nepalense]|uniref:DUF4252 domain-containing protein n=1 Tax=Chryseobacterium nepalense TaxID=1854498 RepID=A0ABY4K8I8_9FLAO|nr:hypothetical protein [Chryseobacterium nepalense]UPQ76661.1 hypothetical protein M0D58_03690 [Chryseobacterium nepalense]
MKTTPLVLLFLLFFQQSFSQKNAWSAIDKSYSIKTISEKSTEILKDTDPVNVKIFSFRDIVDNLDPEKEKPASEKNLSFKDIRDKVDKKGKVNFKRNSVYMVRLKEGLNGGRFRITINKNADKKAVENLNQHLTEKITHGSILKETIDTPESKNMTTGFIITVSDNDGVDINSLKQKYSNIISDITKVATNKSTLFFKITT